MSVTIRKATEAEKGATFRNVHVYIVEKDGRRVGHIEKFKNSRVNIYPWRVFRTGENPQMIGTFYDDADSVKIGPSFDYTTCKIGGKVAAFTFARRVF